MNPRQLERTTTQDKFRGSRARDFTTLEPKQIALYEAALVDLEIAGGTQLLDIGCGAGLFLRLAAQRGAAVAGIDAAPFVEIARERVPDADLAVGEMEALPFGDDSFDAITGFNSFQLGADPGTAMREAGRVGRPGAPILIAAWGRRECCEAAGYIEAVGAPGQFALSEPGALELFAARGGLTPGERREVLCVWSFAGADALLRALKSTGFAVRAMASAGEDAVTDAVLEAVAPYRTSDGGYRLENVFTYVVAQA